MRFDFASVLKLEPNLALAALNHASRQLLLPVDVDNRLRELKDLAVESTAAFDDMKAFIEVRHLL